MGRYRLTRVDPGSQEEGIQRIGDELDTLCHCSRHNRGSRDGKLRSMASIFRRHCCMHVCMAQFQLDSQVSRGIWHKCRLLNYPWVDMMLYGSGRRPLNALPATLSSSSPLLISATAAAHGWACVPEQGAVRPYHILEYECVVLGGVCDRHCKVIGANKGVANAVSAIICLVSVGKGPSKEEVPAEYISLHASDNFRVATEGASWV